MADTADVYIIYIITIKYKTSNILTFPALGICQFSNQFSLIKQILLFAQFIYVKEEERNLPFLIFFSLKV